MLNIPTSKLSKFWNNSWTLSHIYIESTIKLSKRDGQVVYPSPVDLLSKMLFNQSRVYEHSTKQSFSCTISLGIWTEPEIYFDDEIRSFWIISRIHDISFSKFWLFTILFLQIKSSVLQNSTPDFNWISWGWINFKHVY